MPSQNSINNTIANNNFTVPNGTITSSGNILSTAGTVTGIIGVGVGAAPVTSALYVNAPNRIGAWITGTNVSAGADADGLFIDTSFAPSANVVNAASIGLYPTFNPPGGVTITTGYGLYIASGTQGGAGSVTTGYGLFVTHPTFGTTNYAAQIDNMRLDVNSIVATNANGTLTINSDGSGALNLNTTNATGAVNIGTGTSGRTINIGLSAANNLVFLGTSNGTSATNIQAGSGNLILNSTGGTASLDATSGVSINSTAGALNLGDGANAFAVNVGTAGARAVTLGNTTAGTSLALRYGTADFTLASATGTVMSALDTGEITYPLQPAFLAYLGSTVNNVTGNGATFTLGTTTALTEVFDQNADFNTNGTFTAPVTGRYSLVASIRMAEISAVMTLGVVILSTSNRDYQSSIFNYGVARSVAVSADAIAVNISTLADMDSGDTAVFQIIIFGGAGDTADAVGAASAQTYFAGHLAC